eukprot:TRINITY_DN26675_c0_g1_i1.p1 TRINITY_DN26675_c0_g1~~TRINITY_DN26675_c0_g1_i1.p1  ORF type:complete len:496 (-),score=59.80 TRINITY_DN26675_c0_g1_i1:163-1491(-)
MTRIRNSFASVMWTRVQRIASLMLCYVCVFPSGANAKLQSGSLRISGIRQENHWKYVSKFGFGTGTGKYSFKLKLHQPKTLAEDTNLEFTMYYDEEWYRVESEKSPCEKIKHARRNQNVMLKANGEWGEEVTGSFTASGGPKILYFALTDCSASLQNFTHRLKFQFSAQQDSGSEFSIEMAGILRLNEFWLCGFFAFMFVFCKRAMKFSDSAGSIHPVIWTLGIGMLLQCIAHIFHTVHLFAYSYDGQGLKALEVLSEVLFMVSQVMQTSLLILIGLGYTLLQSKIGELDIIIPMCFMLGIIHILLVGFGKLRDDASYKYHENEGPVGWILMILRLLLYAWFLWAVGSSSSEGSAGVKRFYEKFRIAGSIYFLSYPSIFLLTKWFAPCSQYTVMSFGLMSMQMGSNIWLSTLFLTRGDYYKVSTLSASDLPGGCKIGVVKEE